MLIYQLLIEANQGLVVLLSRVQVTMLAEVRTMNIKILIQSVVFVLFFVGIYRYLVWKSRKCDNKECVCPIKDNLVQGYLIVGTTSIIALILFILIELYMK